MDMENVRDFMSSKKRAAVVTRARRAPDHGASDEMGGLSSVR